jgi:hypothetical protein
MTHDPRRWPGEDRPTPQPTRGDSRDDFEKHSQDIPILRPDEPFPKDPPTPTDTDKKP